MSLEYNISNKFYGVISIDNVAKYIESFISLDNDHLATILLEEERRVGINPSVGIEVGKVLGLLIRMINAKKVLEFGTCLGFSTVCMGQALLETGGKLISVEKDKDLYEDTKKNIELAGVFEIVELICGDAEKAIKEINGPFDIILQDSSKSVYTNMLEECIKLTRKGGLIIADDTLFKPMGMPAQLSEPVHKYNEMVFSDKRLYSIILPIGDGVTISTKL
ncbi:O-methyltransferase [Wukongibacter sp. M2B1]|uniref:O-methyltransferase n=1 Tax=Wukongibacter sp. M2B1 TaxID=3088895 RepID=UPI003D78F1A0